MTPVDHALEDVDVEAAAGLAVHGAGRVPGAAEVRAALIEVGVPGLLVAKDPTLWGPAAEPVARARLGWVDTFRRSRALLPRLAELSAELADLDHVVLAGMGGSALAPEVIARTLGRELTVLDTTDPGSVRAALGDRLTRTVVVVSSKSGETVETDSHRRVYLQALVDTGLTAAEAGRHFVVVTDPGSPLARVADEMGATLVLADPDVGGRYSALTAFGLVPAALAGVDVQELLDQAEALFAALGEEKDNPGLALGVALGAAATNRATPGPATPDRAVPRPTGPRSDAAGSDGVGSDGVGSDRVGSDAAGSDFAGSDRVGSDGVGGVGGTGRRDKVVLADDGSGISGLGDWVEQLIAESTGKEGRGILPVVVESPTAPGATGPDVLTITLGGSLILGGVPGGARPRVAVNGPLGAQFLVWEYATAIAGRVLGVNPFDQPDVAGSKDNTERILTVGPPDPGPSTVDGTIRVYGGAGTVAAGLSTLIDEIAPDGYLAISAYLDRGADADAARLRALLARAGAGRPVTFGWGPRFLHSTGQYHKGGPQVGSFLQITGVVEEDLPVPGQEYTFGVLQAAQAAGDRQAHSARGRPLLHLHLTERAAGIAQLLDVAASLEGKR